MCLFTYLPTEMYIEKLNLPVFVVLSEYLVDTVLLVLL